MKTFNTVPSIENRHDFIEYQISAYESALRTCEIIAGEAGRSFDKMNYIRKEIASIERFPRKTESRRSEQLAKIEALNIILAKLS